MGIEREPRPGRSEEGAAGGSGGGGAGGRGAALDQSPADQEQRLAQQQSFGGPQSHPVTHHEQIEAQLLRRPVHLPAAAPAAVAAAARRRRAAAAARAWGRLGAGAGAGAARRRWRGGRARQGAGYRDESRHQSLAERGIGGRV
jgi:hypothetical protein